MLLTEYKKQKRNRGLFLTVVLFVLLVFVFILALNEVSSKTEQQQKVFLENAVHRAVITCFAIEGRYPPSLSYLVENYGLKATTDNEKFIISYRAYASNIYPDIAVLKVGTE